MKVLICGPRTLSDYTYVANILDKIHEKFPFTEVIVGDAKGADNLAYIWATANKITTSIHYADWDQYGKSAGPIRNSEMIEEDPDLVIAFKYEGEPFTKGTADTARKVAKKGIELIVVDVVHNEEMEKLQELIDSLKNMSRTQTVGGGFIMPSTYPNPNYTRTYGNNTTYIQQPYTLTANPTFETINGLTYIKPESTAATLKGLV